MALRKQAIKDVISADAEARFEYLNTDGETCALGGLARAAGVSDDVLRAAYSTKIGINEPYGTVTQAEFEATKVIREAIKEKFGLSIRRQQVIQETNDESLSIADRRERILHLIEAEQF